MQLISLTSPLYSSLLPLYRSHYFLSYPPIFPLLSSFLLSLPSLQTSTLQSLNLFYFIYLFVCLFLAALGLRCCARTFSSCSEQGLLFVVVCGLLIVVASLVVEH